MKFTKKILTFLIILSQFISIKSLANSVQIEFPNDAEYPKAITLKDGNILLIS